MSRNARLAQKSGALVCLAFFAVAGFGQGRRPSTGNDNDRSASGSIRGRIVMPNGSYTNGNIKVTLLNIRETIGIVYTDTQGQFELRNLNSGNYQLEVEADRQKFDLISEPVQVFRGTPTVVTITLREKASPASGSNAAVSISELDPNIPSGAKKEFDKASKLAAAQDSVGAIAHFRKAIELYPRFVMAYNDLGTQLLALGRLEEAAETITKAVALDNKAFNPALNLGIVLVHQHKFVEAASILNTAISLEANSPSARLYAGLAAVGLGNLEVAEKELKTAHSLGGARFAVALYHLGQLYLSRGEKDLALDSFQLYLHEVPDAANSDQVRRTIAMLR